MLVLALAILLQLSLQHHLSAMAALLPSALDGGSADRLLFRQLCSQSQIQELGSAMTGDYVGDRPVRTNEIKLKGYE